MRTLFVNQKQRKLNLQIRLASYLHLIYRDIEFIEIELMFDIRELST